MDMEQGTNKGIREENAEKMADREMAEALKDELYRFWENALKELKKSEKTPDSVKEAISYLPGLFWEIPESVTERLIYRTQGAINTVSRKRLRMQTGDKYEEKTI
jgi:hypothetical protein